MRARSSYTATSAEHSRRPRRKAPGAALETSPARGDNEGDYIMKDSKEMQREHVRRIAEELDAVNEGRAFFFDDDPYTIRYLLEGLYRLPEDSEQAGFGDYFSETYNEHFIVNRDGELQGVRVMVACGGPNVWVDTYSQEVVSYWGSDTERYPLLSSTAEAIDDWAREVFDLR